MGVKTCQGTTLEAAEKLGFLSFRRGAEESLLCRETLRSIVFEFIRILRRGDTYQGPTQEAAEKHCYFFHFCCRDVFRGACCLFFLLFSYFVPALEQLCNTLRLADHTAGSNFLMRTKLQAAAAN